MGGFFYVDPIITGDGAVLAGPLLHKIKIEDWRFLTFPKYGQRPFEANKINAHKF